MAILRAESMRAHRIAHKSSSCWSIRGSVPIYLSHALMLSTRLCLSIQYRWVGFASPANEDYYAVNLIVHNTVPVKPFAVHVFRLVDVFASIGAPSLPYAFHRNSNSRNLNTGNSIALCIVMSKRRKTHKKLDKRHKEITICAIAIRWNCCVICLNRW